MASLVTAVRFDHSSPGGRAGDRSGFGRAAELGGTARIALDHEFGSCLELDGAGSASIPLDDAVATTAGFSVMLWLRLSDADVSGPVLGLLSADAGPIISLSVEKGFPVASVCGELVAAPLLAAADDRWHHWALTVDAKAGRSWWYVDGQSGDVVTVATDDALVEALIGADPSGQHLTGRIAGLRLYTAVLGAQEVRAAMDDDHQPIIPDRSGPVAVFDFGTLAPDGSAPELVRLGRFAKAIGSPLGVVDGIVARATELDGQHDSFEYDDATLLDRAEAFTISAWVRADTIAEVDGLVERPSVPSGRHAPHWALHLERGHVRAYVDGENVGRSTAKLERRRWHHVTVSWDGDVREAHYYLDGVQMEIDGGGRTASARLLQRPEHPVRIGHRGTPSFFGGRMRSVAIHARALSPAEVAASVANDRRTAMDDFRVASPLAFEFVNDRGDPTLAILDDGVPGRSAHLVVGLDSLAPVSLVAGGASPVGPNNHHFELRFPPRTLHPSAFDSMRVADGEWTVAAHVRDDGRQSLYLLANDAVTLHPGQRRHVSLRRLHADPAHGDRPARVLLGYRHLSFVGDDTELAGFCTSTMQVVDERGRPDPPFRIGFAGSSSVVLGETNELSVFIANASSTDRVVLAGPHSDAPSQLIIEFEEEARVGAGRPWVLAPHDLVAAIEIETSSDDLDVQKSTLDRTTVWTISSLDRDIDLGPGERWDLRLRRVPCNDSAGTTQLRIRHENIPGVRDGTTVVAFEKRPWTFVSPDTTRARRKAEEAVDRAESASLLVGDSPAVQAERRAARLADLSARGRLANLMRHQAVGVGTPEPGHTLDVDGDIRARGELLDASGPVLPAGAIVFFADSTDREGWAICDGRTVHDVTTPDLRPGGASFDNEPAVPFMKLPPARALASWIPPAADSGGVIRLIAEEVEGEVPEEEGAP